MKNTHVRNVVQYCDLWYALSVKPGSLKPNLANTPRGFLEGSWKALQSLFYAFEALRSINGYIYNIYALLHFINSWYFPAWRCPCPSTHSKRRGLVSRWSSRTREAQWEEEQTANLSGAHLIFQANDQNRRDYFEK